MEQVTLLVEGFSITLAIWSLDFLCSIRLSLALCCAHSPHSYPFESTKRSLDDARPFDPVHRLSHCNKVTIGLSRLAPPHLR